MWQNFVDDVTDRNYDAIIFTLRRSGVAIFADIIKIVTMFIKESLKTQKNLKELEIRYQNAINICHSWYSKLPISSEKMLMPAELKGCFVWLIYFLDLL